MKFSMYLNAQTRGPQDDVGIIETLARQAIEATHAGFEGVALTEHHFSGYNTYGHNFMMASYLASQVPEGTKFLMAVAVPNLNNPMRLAQKVNLLDVLAKGNLIVGLAAGGSPVEYAGMGRDPRTRRVEFDRNLEIVQQALLKELGDPALDWQTEFEQGRLHTRIMPAGYHRKHPPFARATGSVEGVTWTANRGWYLFMARETPEVVAERWALYERELRADGRAEDEVQERLDWSFLQKQIFVADTKEDADRDIRARLELMADNQRRNWQLVEKVPDADKLRSVVGVSPQDPDEFINRALLVGDPESVAEQIREYEAAGVRHMALLFNFGFMSPAESDRSIRLFMDEVLPKVRPQLGVRG